MSDSREPPPGGGGGVPSQTQYPARNIHPDQGASSVWTDKSVSGGILTTRTFEQIIDDEQKYRNILEIHLVKNDIVNSDGITGKAKSLSFDDIGEFLFDTLNIDPENCISLD